MKTGSDAHCCAPPAQADAHEVEHASVLFQRSPARLPTEQQLVAGGFGL